MKTLLLAPLAVAAFLLGGCAYQLGDARPSMMRGITTLSVPVSKNKTLEPNVEGLLADTIVKQLQSDGTYKVSYTDRADAIVYTTLERVERRRARSVRGNVLATSEYILTTAVNFEVVDRATGKQLQQGTVNGRTSFFVTADLQTDEIQALPLAFSDAAVQLTSRLSEGF
ncbi:MAG: LPS assembly lipoprotein LptE [Chthoniobacterales bacterium]